MDSLGHRSVALPLFAVGAFAAVVIADLLQLWQSGREVPAVLLVATLPLVCVGLGVVAGRWVTQLDRTLAWRLLVGAVAGCGAWAALVVQTGSWVVARRSRS